MLRPALIEATRGAPRQKRIHPKLAEALVRSGGWRYVVTARTRTTRQPIAPDYADRSYKELRELAREAGIPSIGVKRDDLIAALQTDYLTRDMRAG